MLRLTIVSSSSIGYLFKRGEVMKVLEDLNKFASQRLRGVALGNFDGVHLGHQQLIHTLVEKSNQFNIESCIYTFKNHPQEFITGEAPKEITDLDMKIKLFNHHKVDAVVFAEFNEDIMSKSPEAFVEDILVKGLNCKFVVVGFDYRFGHRAKGDVKLLKTLAKEFGFVVFEIPPVLMYDDKISSTRIRATITEGEINLTNLLLGRYYSVYSKVIHGMGRGKFLGYPTANIMIKPTWLLPKDGVYASFVKIKDNLYKAATCVGTNPTFDGTDRTVETFIIDYKGSLYDEYIEIQFVNRLRDNIKFDSVDELINQMMLDVENSKKHLQGKQIMLK